MVEREAQQYLRDDDLNSTLLSSIDNGIMVLDEELNIIQFNQWLQVLTHLQKEDVLNKPIDEIFPTINIKTLKRKVKASLTMNSPAFYSANTTKYLIPIKINQIKITNFEFMRQDIRIVPLDVQRKITAIIITDQTNIIHTQKELQKTLQKVEELNEEILRERETIDERVNLIKIDNDCLITEVSQSYLNLLDINEKDILNKDLFEYENSNISSELKQEILNHIQEKKILKYEQISNDRHGRDIWFSNTLVPDYDKDHEHCGFIIFGDNITDAKLVQLQQEKLLETSRSAAMGEMISMIAHQWRQPLNVISTLIATLKIKKEMDILTDEIQTNSYSKIEETVKFLTETIDDFRNFFKQNKELTGVNLSFIFEKSTSFIKSEMEKSQIRYTQEIDENIQIDTYQNELIQAIMNIIKNSIDAFNDIDINNKELTVLVTQNNDQVHIEIEDNAGGIPAENLSKVFEPYFSTKSKNGTGLGLYMCKTIVEEHLQGEISMQSKNGQTKTSITLPKNLS